MVEENSGRIVGFASWDQEAQAASGASSSRQKRRHTEAKEDAQWRGGRVDKLGCEENCGGILKLGPVDVRRSSPHAQPRLARFDVRKPRPFQRHLARRWSLAHWLAMILT